MKIFILLPALFCPIKKIFLIWIYSSYTSVLHILFFICSSYIHIYVHIFWKQLSRFASLLSIFKILLFYIFVFLWFNIFYYNIFCLLILSTSVCNLLLNSFTAILVILFISLDYSISISLLFSITDLWWHSLSCHSLSWGY